MGILRDCWGKEGSLQVVRATCHNYFVCVCMHAVLACMHGCMNLCMCVHAPIVWYSIVKEATIQIAKIAIRFSTSLTYISVNLSVNLTVNLSCICCKCIQLKLSLPPLPFANTTFLPPIWYWL